MKDKTLRERWNEKTPKFWKRVQRIGITVGAISAVILTAPISLPVGLVTLAGYMATVGAVTATLSQLTIDDKK